MHVVLVYVTKLVDSQEMLRQMLKQTIKMVRMCVVCVCESLSSTVTIAAQK